MSQDVYRAFRSARDVWAEAEEALLSGRSHLSEWEERASSPQQREAFEQELKKSAAWDRMQGMTGSGTAVARSRRGWLRDTVVSFDSHARPQCSESDQLQYAQFSGDQLNLTRAENAQPATLACTLSILAVLRKEFDVDLITEHVSLAAGHGTGIYASLVASGAVDIGDATRLLRHRGLMSSKCVEESEVLFPPGCDRPDTIYEVSAVPERLECRTLTPLPSRSLGHSPTPAGAFRDLHCPTSALPGAELTHLRQRQGRRAALERGRGRGRRAAHQSRFRRRRRECREGRT
jgi:malonyl CoA-acyl carrier protein transacylase